MIALFVGRFQPFHRGHLWAVKEIIKRADKVIIAIGSSQDQRTPTNPFSARERRDMIETALKAEHISRYAIFEVPDMTGDHTWVNHVRNIIPKFDIVYTGNALGKQLFSDEGYEVVDLPRYENISGTEVRLRMAKGMDWQMLVHPKVAAIVREINPALHAASRRSEQ